MQVPESGFSGSIDRLRQLKYLPTAETKVEGLSSRRAIVGSRAAVHGSIAAYRAPAVEWQVIAAAVAPAVHRELPGPAQISHRANWPPADQRIAKLLLTHPATGCDVT